MSEINLRNVSIEFPIFAARGRSFKNFALSAVTGGKIATNAHETVTVRALDDISLTVKEGERVGLVGHNGSGKSTLLRVIAGSYYPSKGFVNITGKIISLLSITHGMSGDLTGYENIFLRMSLLGVKRSEAKRYVSEIIEFSELGEFINLPVRTYSSGMFMRLAFSIVTSLEADIILMDEWLSVGDSDFLRKSQDRLDSMLNKAKIIILASHNSELIDRICTRRLLMAHGKITEI